MKCNNCGSENPMGSYYCGNCQFPMQMYSNIPGNVTPQSKQGLSDNVPKPIIKNHSSKPYPSNNSKSTIYIIVSVVGIFLVASIIYLFTRQSGGNESNPASETPSTSQNSERVKVQQTQPAEEPSIGKSNSQQNNSTYTPPSKEQSTPNNYSSTDVRSFLTSYSQSLLRGNYFDHANLYASMSYFLSDQIRSRSEIERMAKNFYNTYETTEHYFSIESITPLDNGDISVIVVEHQSTRRYSDSKTSSAVQRKLVVLTRENGSLKSYRQKNL